MGANIHRRDILKLAGVTLTSSLTAAPVRAQTKRPKKVIISGAGIAGLCCSYELMKRGHEIIVLEASGRPGGHVRTIHDPLPDGLYADTGAEHFYKPGYDVYWRYLEEFNLPVVAYPRRDHMMRIIGGKVYSEEDLQSRHILGQLGFNQREVDFLKIRPWWDLPLLYLQQYVDEIHDERQPFGVGLDHLDQITVTELFKKAGASDAAIRFGGGHGPALQEVWQSSIKKLRGAPRLSRKLFRIRGGNQRMTDAFASRLGKSVLLGCPVTGMRQGDTGVTVQYLDSGRERSIDADYLVSCMSLVMLSRIPVKPDWPEDKKYIIRNMPYYTVARVIFQSRSAFWKEDQISPNWETEDPDLRSLWSMAEEVNTPRAILIGDAESTTSEEKAIAAFRRIYPGKSENIEQALVVNWAIDPWALACERTSYKPGDLAKFWPKVIEPYGRIHFAGAYAAHMPWGQEAAVESANRVAEAIDKA